MKIKPLKTSGEIASNLLSRILRFYPYNHEKVPEVDLTRIRRVEEVWEYFWSNVVYSEMDKKGFILKMFEDNYFISVVKDYNKKMALQVNRIFSIIHYIDDKIFNKNGINETRSFLEINQFFYVLYSFLKVIEYKSNWKDKINKKYGLTDVPLNNLGYALRLNDIKTYDYLLSPEDFREQVNHIFNLIPGVFCESYGDIIVLDADGKLRYIDAFMEAEEKRRTFLLLSEKYENVIDYLDKVTKNIKEKNFDTALSECRKALEGFYKRLLLNHGIKFLSKTVKGKRINVDIEDAMINDLVNLAKLNIAKLFKFPKYSNINQIESSFSHLIISSGGYITGLANPVGSHGKSKKPYINLKHAKAAESFLILLINSLLPFER